jgi:hypothetical protein
MVKNNSEPEALVDASFLSTAGGLNWRSKRPGFWEKPGFLPNSSREESEYGSRP